MSTEKFPSRAGLKTAVVGAVAGAASAWFAIAVLTVPRPVVVAAALLVGAATAAYQAGWVARGRTDGR